MASGWGSGGSWSRAAIGSKILGFWRVKQLRSVQSLGYRGCGMGMWDGDAARSTYGGIEVPVTSPRCPHLLHVLFQEESLGLGRVPGTRASRAPLARVTSQLCSSCCGCAQLQAAWLASSSLNLSLSTRI